MVLSHLKNYFHKNLQKIKKYELLKKILLFSLHAFIFKRRVHLYRRKRAWCFTFRRSRMRNKSLAIASPTVDSFSLENLSRESPRLEETQPYRGERIRLNSRERKPILVEFRDRLQPWQWDYPAWKSSGEFIAEDFVSGSVQMKTYANVGNPRVDRSIAPGLRWSDSVPV